MYALTVTNLCKSYPNKLQALRDVSFNVVDGDFFALLGPNGAGKSTLIGILSSLLDKTSGKVSILGYDIDQDFRAAKNLMGFVPQEFNFNVFHNPEHVLYNQAGYYGISNREVKPRIEYYLKQLGLWDKRRAMIRTLSGGMRRRLMIARALIHDPKMLILDEPTAGVDIELRRLMWDFLIELNLNGTTIILTTHYLEEAEFLCRNIAILDEGKLIAHESMSSLLNKLESERYILYLQDKLAEAPSIPGYKLWKIDDSTLEVEVAKELGLSNLFKLLTQKGIKITSMRNKVSRLEELFLRLTTEAVWE